MEENVGGLDFILKLRPVTYNIKALELARHIRNDEQRKELNEKMTEADKQAFREREAQIQTGFIAQEVEKAAQEADFNFSGVEKPHNEETGHYSLRYAEFTVPLVKAVQELHGESEELRVESEELRVENAALKEEVSNLQSEIQNQQERLSKLEALMSRFDTDLQSCCFNSNKTETGARAHKF